MRFLADMGVSQRVVKWLREAGHEAVHLRDEGLQRLPDAEIFAKAIAERRVVLTFDLDFGEIAALAGNHAASVILFRLQDTSTPHVIERLSSALATTETALEGSAIVLVEERRLRIRHLPISK